MKPENPGRTPQEKYESMKSRGRSDEQIRAVAAAREDNQLLRFMEKKLIGDMLQ